MKRNMQIRENMYPTYMGKLFLSNALKCPYYHTLSIKPCAYYAQYNEGGTVDQTRQYASEYFPETISVTEGDGIIVTAWKHVQ